MNNIVIAAFYKFVELPDYETLQPALLEVCLQQNLKGTILLAEEGINGTLSGSRQGIDSVLTYLKKDSRFADLLHKESFADDFPFRRMKVRLKKEIVTLGKPEADPKERVGNYASPEEWNDLLNDPEVLLLDARNEYEVAIGTFKGATNPETNSFRDFPGYVETNLDPEKHKKIAMFCTGGIRCEKATSYLLGHGFEKVYHLQGGILKYLEKTPQDQNLWQGECFVFDDRVAVDHNLEKGSYRQCYACRMPISDDDMKSPRYLPGISCPHCADSLTDDQRSRFAERQKQIELAIQRKEASAAE